MYELLRRRALRPLPAAVPRPLLPPVGGADPAGSAAQDVQQQQQQSGEQEQQGSAQQQQGRKGGTHQYTEDPRNADILIGMRDGVTGGRLVLERLSRGCEGCLQHAMTAASSPASSRSGACCTAPYSLAPPPPPPHAGRFDLVWRPEARVSVLDSGFMLGDGVWEGVRLHRGALLFAQVRAGPAGWLGGWGEGCRLAARLALASDHAGAGMGSCPQGTCL